jgi:hypothetical protein
MKYLVTLVVTILLSACGSGSKGGQDADTYQIELNQRQAELLTSPYGDSVTNVEITVTFRGAGVVVGYPPGASQPGWLYVEPLSSGANSARFKVGVPQGVVMAPGTHTAILRFSTGDATGAHIQYADLNVQLIVEEEFKLSTPAAPYFGGGIFLTKDLEFWSVGDSEDDIHPKEIVYFTIHGDRSIWEISNEAEWLTISREKGEGKTTVELQVNTEGLDYGLYQTTITVSDAHSGMQESLPVSFDYQPEINAVATSNSSPWHFDFKITELLVNQTNQKIYITDANQKKLFIVNAITGETEKYFDFAWIPWKMTISSDNSSIYLGLTEKIHSPYYWMEEQKGRVVVIDVNTEQVVDEFRMNIAPGDLVVTDDDRLFLGGGSSQHPPILQYNAKSGVYENILVSSTSPVVRMELAPDQQSFIYRSSWQAPPPVYKVDLNNPSPSSLLSEFEADHGDWEPTIEFWLTPDGNHLLTSYGDLYTTENAQLVKRLTAPYVYLRAVAMDKDNQRMIALDTEKRLMEYDLTTFSEPAILATRVEATDLILHINGEFRAKKETGSGTSLELLNW